MIPILPLLIRVLLTLVLILGAYTETGLFTALCLLLISVSNELIGFWMGLVNKRFKAMGIKL